MKTDRYKLLTTNVYFNVIYEPDEEGGYIVFAPVLPGCHSQGDTLEEARKNIQEAVEVYLLSLKDSKEDIPKEDKSFVGTVNVKFNHGI